MKNDYQYLIELLAEGDIEMLEESSEMIDDFPEGKDSYFQRHWITNAIDCGCFNSVKWILDKGVDLSFTDEEGCTPLLSAIDREFPDKYEVLQLLIKRGSPLNKQGWNDWTPLHQAAAREDIQSLEILVNSGADLNVRTRIDDYATPLEEAKNMKRTKSIAFLENII